MNSQQPDITTADHRRAAALIAHHGNGDDDGMEAILEQAHGEGRIIHLLLALLELYQVIAPALYTPLGLQLLSDTILRLAAVEEETP